MPVGPGSRTTAGETRISNVTVGMAPMQLMLKLSTLSSFIGWWKEASGQVDARPQGQNHPDLQGGLYSGSSTRSQKRLRTRFPLQNGTMSVEEEAVMLQASQDRSLASNMTGHSQHGAQSPGEATASLF